MTVRGSPTTQALAQGQSWPAHAHVAVPLHAPGAGAHVIAVETQQVGPLGVMPAGHVPASSGPVAQLSPDCVTTHRSLAWHAAQLDTASAVEASDGEVVEDEPAQAVAARARRHVVRSTRTV